jgi:hypothetical protein
MEKENRMSIVLSQSTPIAKKEHGCDACTWLINGGYPEGMSISEWRSVVRAKRNKWKIKAGQKYIRQTGIYEGDFYCSKSIPEIHEICLKYDIYED